MNNIGRIAVAVAVVLGVQACASKESRVAEHLTRGKEMFAKQDYDKAKVELKNVLQIDPKNVDAILTFARIFEKTEAYTEAAGQYRRAVELDDKQTGAKTALARLLLMGGAIDEASKYAEQALAVDPNDSAALVVRAGVMARGENVEGAKAIVLSVLRKDAANLDAALMLAGIYHSKKETESAISVLETAKQYHPREFAPRGLLMQLYVETHKEEKAVEVAREIATLEPEVLVHRVRLAKLYASLKRFQEGEQVLRDGLKQPSAGISDKLALAEYLTAIRGRDAAAKELQAMADAEPKEYTLRFALARLKSLEDAEKMLRAVIDEDGTGKDGLAARVQLATLLANGVKKAEAEKLLQEVLKQNSQDNDALLLRASLEMSRHDAPAAIADLRSLLKDQPTNARALGMLAGAHVMNNEHALARDLLKRGLDVNAGSQELRYLLAQFYYQQGDFKSAAVEFKTLAESKPDNIAVADGLFKSLAANGDWKTAIAIANGYKTKHPNLALGYYLSGLEQEHRKAYQDAERSYSQALAKPPRSAEAMTAWVRMCIASKQYDKALKWLADTAKSDGNQPLVHELSGEIHVLMKDYAGARQDFQRARDMDPKLAVIYRNLSGLSLLQDKPEDAVRVLEDGITATGGDTQLYFALAELNERKGNFKKAMETYEAVLARDPSSQVAANNLLMLLATHKSDSASVERAKQLSALLVKTSNPNYLDTLGWSHYQRDEIDNALTYYNQAITKAPNEPVLQYHLGLAYYKKGNAIEAKKYLQQAVASKARFSGFDDATSLLKKLQHS